MDRQNLILQRASLRDTGLSRDWPPDFMPDPLAKSGYDHETLWYDAIWTGHWVALVCPTLFNLLPEIEAAGLFLDDRRVAIRRLERRQGHDILWLSARTCPTEVSVVLKGVTVRSGISHRSDGALFKGLNTAMTLSRDNDPAWIRDWAFYHRKVHGLEAVLFFDNGSETYGPDTITAALEVAGIEKAVICSAPYPLGQPGTSKSTGAQHWGGRSLQMALLNIARLRMLRQARAVLQCDIDELVWSTRGSIFDRAVRHPLGLVRLGGQWRYQMPDSDGPPRHRFHTYRLRDAVERCPAKYCIRPRGPLRFASWKVHSLARLRQNVMIDNPTAGFWHMRQITRNWKPSENRLASPGALVEDATTRHGLEPHDWPEL